MTATKSRSTNCRTKSTFWSNSRTSSFFLQADKDVSYGLVVDVMGRIREAGIDKLGVVALREDVPAAGKKGNK